MKIKKIIIKNFRSIKEQTIACDNQTIFIGSNGSGKSTVLKALHAFFDITFKPTTEDYFAHKANQPIEITLVFSDFTEDEIKDFESRIHAGEMSVTRAFGGEKVEDGNYHSLIYGCVDFQKMRTATKAGDKKTIYADFISKGYSLAAWKNQGEAENALYEWERNNPEKCELIKDGGQFFGFKSVGGGKLQNATNFIMIEAVRDVSEDANDQKNSAIGQLMDLIVRSAMKQNEKIKKYQAEVNQQYAILTSPDNFPQLGSLQTALTTSLKTYYHDVGVKLDWRETAGISMPPPQAEIKFREDNFEYPVEKAGNGVQRAFIISLLHQLLVAKSNNSTTEALETSLDAEIIKQPIAEKSLLEKLPSIILAIEEPELYQHPTKQWHFAQVLKRLSSGELKKTFGDVQVLFCTHSPSFIALSQFHNARIAVKETCNETGVKQTILRNASLADVAKMIEKTWEKETGSCTEASTLALLHTFGTELSEGFFSDGVVLVEGITDKAALEAVAEATGNSFIENNIAILPVYGKGNIDKPWMVFTQLGIPVFPLWDSDADCSQADKSKTTNSNGTLQRMLGISKSAIVDFPKGVFDCYACFENNLEQQLKSDFGESFDPAYQKACEIFDLTAKQGKKNPYVISELIRNLYKQGEKSEMLETLLKSIFSHFIPEKQKMAQNKAA